MVSHQMFKQTFGYLLLAIASWLSVRQGHILTKKKKNYWKEEIYVLISKNKK